MDYPCVKASAEGTPVRLIVQPALIPFFEEGFGVCSENDTTHGPYLATTSVQLAHSFNNWRHEYREMKYTNWQFTYSMFVANSERTHDAI